MIRIVGGVSQENILLLHITKKAGQMGNENVFGLQLGHEPKNVVDALGSLPIGGRLEGLVEKKKRIRRKLSDDTSDLLGLLLKASGGIPCQKLFLG